MRGLIYQLNVTFKRQMDFVKKTCQMLSSINWGMLNRRRSLKTEMDAMYSPGANCSLSVNLFKLFLQFCVFMPSLPKGSSGAYSISLGCYVSTCVCHARNRSLTNV